MAVKEVVSGRLVGAAEAGVGHVVIGFTLLQGTRLEITQLQGTLTSINKVTGDIKNEIFIEILIVIEI